MNNTFNFSRFVLLFKKHTVEHFKTNLLSIGVLVGMLFLVLGFCSYGNHGHLFSLVQFLTFTWFLLLGGSIYTSLAFTELSDKKQAIPALTLPVSNFEKYLVAWLYSFVIFQIIMIGAFYLIDSIVISMGAPPIDETTKIINVFTMNAKPASVFVIFAVLHSFTFWGSLFFEKLHFIKTSFVFFIAVAVLILLNNELLKISIGNDVMGGIPFNGTGIRNGYGFWEIDASKGISQLGWFIVSLTVLLLWTSAFFRLKEKEV